MNDHKCCVHKRTTKDSLHSISKSADVVAKASVVTVSAGLWLALGFTRQAQISGVLGIWECLWFSEIRGGAGLSAA